LSSSEPCGLLIFGELLTGISSRRPTGVAKEKPSRWKILSCNPGSAWLFGARHPAWANRQRIGRYSNRPGLNSSLRRMAFSANTGRHPIGFHANSLARCGHRQPQASSGMVIASPGHTSHAVHGNISSRVLSRPPGKPAERWMRKALVQILQSMILRLIEPRFTIQQVVGTLLYGCVSANLQDGCRAQR